MSSESVAPHRRKKRKGQAYVASRALFPPFLADRNKPQNAIIVAVRAT